MSSGVDSGAPPSYEEASSGVDLPKYEEVSSGEPLPEYEEGYPIDIVAIHGLTGDNRTTWEANDVYWLRDFLPSDLPGVRVFSFGYKAGVSNSTGTAGLDSWAQELLNYVKMTLRRPQAKVSNSFLFTSFAQLIAAIQNPYRPIFLVCHGMGGILAKKVSRICFATSKLLIDEGSGGCMPRQRQVRRHQRRNMRIPLLCHSSSWIVEVEHDWAGRHYQSWPREGVFLPFIVR